jgi:hypothetical protein
MRGRRGKGRRRKRRRMMNKRRGKGRRRKRRRMMNKRRKRSSRRRVDLRLRWNSSANSVPQILSPPVPSRNGSPVWSTLEREGTVEQEDRPES